MTLDIYTHKHQKMGISDKGKADLFLLGVILMFLILTLIAFLMNEGKQRFLDPVLGKLLPNRKSSGSDNDSDGEEGNSTRSRWIQSHDSRRQRGDDTLNSNESREMKTIVEHCSSDEDDDKKKNKDKKTVPKINVSDTTVNL